MRLRDVDPSGDVFDDTEGGGPACLHCGARSSLATCRAAWTALEDVTVATLEEIAYAIKPVAVCGDCGKVLKGGAAALGQHRKAKGCRKR